MISRSFYFQIVLRVVLISVFSLITAYAWFHSWYWTFAFGTLLLCTQTVFLIRFLNRANLKMAYFFEAVKNEDFTLRYTERVRENSLKALHHSLNGLNERIQDTYREQQAREQYYQEILRQAEIGMLGIDSRGHILFANPKVERLLNYRPLNHLKQLSQVDPALYEIFRELKPFDRKLVQLTNEREKTQLAVKATGMVLNGKEILVVIIHDIQKELDEKETDSWMRLIRVLTHEIMNTITPITSISESLLKMLSPVPQGVGPTQWEGEISRSATRGLEVIREQGTNLMNFVQSYRSFLNVPAPDKTLVSASRLLEKVVVLLDRDISQAGVHVEYRAEPGDLQVFVDEKQLSQVLINLCRNALQALEGQANGQIILEAGRKQDGRTFIRVQDNGPGIDPEHLEDIFVPFYTTKEKGSGIGLSLSKQILRLHGGSLSVHSLPGRETVFVLEL